MLQFQNKGLIEKQPNNRTSKIGLKILDSTDSHVSHMLNTHVINIKPVVFTHNHMQKKKEGDPRTSRQEVKVGQLSLRFWHC